MYDDCFKNYSPYPTYTNDYDDYFEYENDYYNMNNEYDRFMARQVNNVPYDFNRKTYIDVSSMYPEIYKKISPMIEKRLKSNNIIDNETLDKITFDIYDEIANTDIGKKLNVQVGTISTGSATSTYNQNTRVATNSSTISNRLPNSNNSQNNKIANQGINKYAPASNLAVSSQSTIKDNVKEVSNRPGRSNCLLCDLIKILILNKLTGDSKTSNPGPRPPYPPPHRPPRPGMLPNRPSYPRFNASRPVGNVGPSYFDVPYPEDF